MGSDLTDYPRGMTRLLPVRSLHVHAAMLALVTCGAPALADREAVEQAMAAMEKAVLAGDVAGYLKNVVPATGSHADPVFRKEQENWAADLKLHVPEMFDLAVGDPGEKREVFGDDRAEFELTMSWRMPARESGDGPGGKGGKDRAVSFPAVFVRGGDGEWLFAGEQWVVIDSTEMLPDAPADTPMPAARAKAVAGLDEVAQRVLEVMPEVRAHCEEGFELKVKHTQEVKVYADMKHLQASIYLSYSDPLGGWNEPGESIKLLASPRTGKGSLRTLLAHEFGHVATFEMGPKATDMPWWLVEGVAELSAEKFASRGKDAAGFARTHAKAGTLAPWAEMTDFRKTPDKWMNHVYKQGQAMAGYVSEKYGRTTRNAWLREMAQGGTLDDATKHALGLSFDDLDTQWRASVHEAVKKEQEEKATEPKEAAKEPEAPKDGDKAPVKDTGKP